MKGKTLYALLLLVVVINLSPVALVQSQQQMQHKGGFPIEFYDVSHGQPSKPRPPEGGIATGVVSDSPPSSKRWAVMIGISDYYGTANDLQYCDDDAKDFENALVVKYGWSESNIKLLTDGQATKANILLAISWLRENEKSGDEVIFFYSGHGSFGTHDMDNDGEKKDVCIIPWECTLESFIWDGDLKAEFSNFESTRILFCFDSCYSGGMTDLAGAGRLICMSCKETQMSWEDNKWNNGQFTYYFVDQGMLAHKADANNDGFVTCEEAFDYARAHCRIQAPTASDNFTNDMLP
jgi:hypothetical protein